VAGVEQRDLVRGPARLDDERLRVGVALLDLAESRDVLLREGAEGLLPWSFRVSRASTRAIAAVGGVQWIVGRRSPFKRAGTAPTWSRWPCETTTASGSGSRRGYCGGSAVSRP